MGKLMSKINPADDQNEEEKEIRKYEEQTENNPYGYGMHDTDDLKKITWCQRLLFDLRFRIAYALLVAILLGIAVPIVVHLIFYDNSDSTIYGSCLIKTEARFQCLINNAEPANRQQCVNANCCWEDNTDLVFKCFHSFPSAYQYRVEEIRELPEDGIQLKVNPNHVDVMSKLTILIKWIETDHLHLQIFNPNHYPQREMNGLPTSDKQRSIERNGMIIKYADENDYFFIQILRNGGPNGNETIFDTRLGPINSGVSGGFMAFTTTLSTPYFYGLTGGEGISSKGTLTYGVMNGFENAELPFYMALENSNSWHGLLLETTLPFMVQVLQAPGIGFHIEGPKADINLHLFMGPTQNETLIQLHSYISSKIENKTESPNLPYIPPYWGLGLHLCRKSNASIAWSHIKELNEVTNPNTGQRRIIYDSDCIDMDLRDPFGIDYANFPPEQIQMIVEFLSGNASKKIVLSQKIAIPFTQNETDLTEIAEFLLMDKTNQSDIRPFFGMIDNLTVIYPDYFHPNIFNSLAPWKFDFGNISLDGFILVDNFPKNEAIDSFCKEPDSFLQKLFYSSNVSVDDSTARTNPWGSVCPGIRHTIALDESGESTDEKTHLELHNAFGLQTMLKFRDILNSFGEENPEEEMTNGNLLLSTSSAWSESLYHGANNGMDANFTWIGLRESLAHVLRQFILSPVTGTSICGSFLPEEHPVLDNNLCLRWYQFALLLPFAYHNYAYLNDSRGPLDFPQRYQDYLREAIRQRYTYAPYYYTLLTSYQKTFVPMILPMSYLFHNVQGVDKNTVFKLLDQFMIGEAILAAPIVRPELNRETYFPPGIWYDSDGFVAWEDANNGGFKKVTGYLSQTPLFLRGGHIIPTLQNPFGNSIIESRDGNYTLLVTLIPNLESRGTLLADSGMNKSSPIVSEITFEVKTLFSEYEVRINITISVVEANCENIVQSTIIDHIKFLGFPYRFSQINVTYEEYPELELDAIPGDELDNLRIGEIGMDWCSQDVANINIIAKQQ